MGEFFRLSFGNFFRVSVSGVEAGRKEGKEVRKVQKRRQRSGTSWVFPIPIFRLSVPCSLFFSRFGFSVFEPGIFQFSLVSLSLCIWFAAFAPSCDYYTSRCSLWLSRVWIFRVAPAGTATASGGEALRPAPQPPFSSFRFLGRHPV